MCMHEEDYGTLWKHTDWRTNRCEVRRSRRLVISFFATVGNYDYGFFWYLYQSGEIQLEVKLTGCLSVGAYPPGEQPTHGALVAPQLYAPIHQHYFNYRLDMDVDGPGNSVYEVDTIADPLGPANPYNGSYRPQIHADKQPVGSRARCGPRDWARLAGGEPVAPQWRGSADRLQNHAWSGRGSAFRARGSEPTETCGIHSPQPMGHRLRSGTAIRVRRLYQSKPCA